MSVLPRAPVIWLVLVVLSPDAVTSVEAHPLIDRSDSTPPPPQMDTQGPHEWRDQPPASLVQRRSAPPVSVLRDGFASVQVNVDASGANILGDAANEPSIAIDPTNPNRIVIGWRQFDTVASNFRQAGCGYSRDAGRTWTFPGVLDPGVFRSDPVLDSDSGGNFYFYSLKEDYTCDLFKSLDGGASWVGPIPAYGGDKAWIAIDRTTGAGRGNFYAAWDYAGCCNGNWFTRSTDAGETYDYPAPIPNRPMWGVTTVAPDGAVYVAGRKRSSSQEFAVARASAIQDPNSPLVFEQVTNPDFGGFHRYLDGGPNPGGLLGQVWIAADHSLGQNHGAIYALCSVSPPGPDPLDVMFIRSDDRGETWSAPVRVNDDPNGTIAYQWFGTMSVAPNGRIDVIWNDTRSDPTPANATYSELYYSYSIDGGASWSANVAVSPPFNHFLGYPNQNKLGDYYDAISDGVGLNVAYAATFNGEQDVWYLRIGDFDCNGNGIGDSDDLAEGTAEDLNANGIPDECDCLGDLNHNWTVDLADLATLLSNYGAAAGGEYENGDVDEDGDIDLADLALLLNRYGLSCP